MSLGLGDFFQILKEGTFSKAPQKSKPYIITFDIGCKTCYYIIEEFCLLLLKIMLIIVPSKK